MKKIKLLLVAIMLYSSFAIAQNEDKAKVIIMRETGLGASGSSAKIYMNGEEIFKLSNNRYFEMDIDQGNYNFSVSLGLASKKKGEELIKIKAEKNNTYYFQVKITSGLVTRIYLEEITKNTFENKVSGLKKSEKDN
jgi:hypothetical protein